MLCKSSFGNNFNKKLRIQMVLSSVVVISGVMVLLLLIPSIREVFFGNKIAHDESFMSGFYTGLAGGLIGAGLATIYKTMKIKKNKEKYEKAKVDYYDERNRYIIGKTFIITTYVSLFGLLFAVIISGMINFLVFKTLLISLGIYGLILLITYTITNKSY